MNEIRLFENDEFNLELVPHGDSFKVNAAGLARALGFREAYDLLRNIPDDEKGSEIVRTPGGDQRVLVVTEAGFYRALGQRQLARIKDLRVRASVQRFQSWVYGDVLPSLRRTSAQVSTPPLKIDVTVSALAELAHREHVVPAAGRILAFERWHKTPKGVRAFVQLTIELGIPGIEGDAAGVRALTANDGGEAA